MKTKLITLFTSIVLGGLSLLANAEANHHVIVAIAPSLPPELRDGIARLTANLMIDSPAGSQITVFDAAKMNTVIQANVGDGAKRMRQQRLTPQIALVVAAIRAATNSGVCFNVPVVLDHASRELRQSGAKATVLLVGPALYQNANEPAFDMTAAWPSDGHLAAGSKRSIFSTSERTHRLDGMSVAWVVTDTQSLQNEAHREGVARFWTLFVGSQGGKLVSYSPDARTIFARAFEEKATAGLMTATKTDDSEVIMRSRKFEPIQRTVLTNAAINSIQESILPIKSPVEAVAVPSVLVLAETRSATTNVTPLLLAPEIPDPKPSTPETPSLETSVPEIPVKQSPAQSTPVPELPEAESSAPISSTTPPPSLATILPTVARENTGIAITWERPDGHSENVDLDLYVQPPDGGRELYCAYTNSAYGRYYRDIRSSLENGTENWRSEWEFVELYGDQLPEYVWVNLFYGKGPIRGKLRLQYHGRATTTTFVINARKGSRGDDVNQRERSPAWVRLDLSAFKDDESAP